MSGQVEVAARPRLHFTARRGWINDPLAVTWHDGRYHLFFQYVPDSIAWTPACWWGHAVSEDLLDWTELTPVLAPGDGDDGVWSGSLAIGRDGEVTIFSTAVSLDNLDLGRIRVARPVDNSWGRWHKGAVVVAAPSHPATRMFRDPNVTRNGDRWRMLVGAALTDGRAAVLGWSSDDLASWTPDGVVVARRQDDEPGGDTGTGWECPQLIDVCGTSLLIVSVWDPDRIRHVIGSAGRFVDGRFEAAGWQRLTWGAPYAATAFRDADDRPCLMFWIRGAADAAGTWAGAESVPHVVSLRSGRIVLTPHPALAEEGRPLQRSPIERWRTELEKAEAAGFPCRSGTVLALEDETIVELWSDDGVAAFTRAS